MGAFERLQSLPSLVIERIIEFTVNHSRHHYSDFIQYTSSMDVMMSELLNISSKWNAVVFEVSYGCILNGTALPVIQRILSNKPQLGLVRVLRIKFTYFDKPGENESPERTQKFIEHIEYMVPGITRVVLEGVQFSEPMDDQAGLALGMLITGLYGMAKDIEYKGSTILDQLLPKEPRFPTSNN
ncbi:hypothetical protein GGH96_003517 [Coemansia sp. RSA 1972]|nr:hypothetical protein GGH96_003517 [Coemansia sp. RSA 1972]